MHILVHYPNSDKGKPYPSKKIIFITYVESAMISFTTRWNPTWKVICLVQELETEPTAKNSITEKWNACVFLRHVEAMNLKSPRKQNLYPADVSLGWLLLKLHTHKTNVSFLINCLTWFVLQEPQLGQIYQNMSYI